MKKRKIKKKVLASITIIGIFLVLLFVSGCKIINYLKDNKENKEIVEELSEMIVPVIKNDEEVKVEYNVDFKGLKEKNSDTVAYLKVKGTSIDYVVLKGEDNEFYLKHNFNKEKNVSGWVFADFHNKFDGMDKNIVIYAHNTRDGSMFGTLKSVLNEDWQKNKDNLKIVFVTEKGLYYYQVFSTYTALPEDYYIKTSFIDENEFSEFVNIIKARSNNDYNVEVTKDDNLLTLSSCVSNGSKRVVLHAKLVLDKE